MIEEPSEINPKQRGLLSCPTGQIEFKDVIFRYPSRQKAVLRRLNLKIQPNQSVAIVGHSGTGKSTISSLLFRFYDCQSGQILLDGQEIRDLDLKCLRSQISIVQQEPNLFNRSIYENILYGDADLANSKNYELQSQLVLEATKQANALGFVTQSLELDELLQQKILTEFKQIAGLPLQEFVQKDKEI
jgi:ABC-type multidrug transport system fused ATPase/permease subunit